MKVQILMNNPLYGLRHTKKKKVPKLQEWRSNDFGLRSHVIQKTFHTETVCTPIVARLPTEVVACETRSVDDAVICTKDIYIDHTKKQQSRRTRNATSPANLT